MPIKIYVSRDSQGRPWPPDYGHETQACLEIIKRLWVAFNGRSLLIAVAANLHHPSADLVVVTSRGIGIAELKHYAGHISWRPNGNWYAGKFPILAGTSDRPYVNPHAQVQAYALQLRDKLVRPIRPPGWLPGLARDWQQFKFQTTVCFTHPDVHFDELRKHLRRNPDNMPWEEFRVLTPAEMADWVASLRFSVSQGPAKKYEPYHLENNQIVRIATDLLKLTEWTEIIDLMPTGDPYAYLSVVENGSRTQAFSLDRDEITVGRDVGKCAVLIPYRYTRVSRLHARLRRTVDGVYIEDLGSKNGTFLNRQPLGEPHELQQGDQILLGGRYSSDKVCMLEFSFGFKTAEPIRCTETGP